MLFQHSSHLSFLFKRNSDEAFYKAAQSVPHNLSIMCISNSTLCTFVCLWITPVHNVGYCAKITLPCYEKFMKRNKYVSECMFIHIQIEMLHNMSLRYSKNYTKNNQNTYKLAFIFSISMHLVTLFWMSLRTRQIGRFRATATLRWPQTKQCTVSNEVGTKPAGISYNFDNDWNGDLTSVSENKFSSGMLIIPVKNPSSLYFK